MKKLSLLEFVKFLDIEPTDHQKEIMNHIDIGGKLCFNHRRKCGQSLFCDSCKMVEAYKKQNELTEKIGV